MKVIDGGVTAAKGFQAAAAAAELPRKDFWPHRQLRASSIKTVPIWR